MFIVAWIVDNMQPALETYIFKKPLILSSARSYDSLFFLELKVAKRLIDRSAIVLLP
jgi:hypothetical protein